jgi:hypothetical protein
VNQHLVSRVLLRRWANYHNGPVSTLNLESYEEHTVPVEQLGSTQDLTAEGTVELEQVWSKTVERRLNHPLSLVESKEILDARNAEHLQYLKDCIALHWARSFAVTTVLRMLQPGFADRVATSVLRSYTPTAALKAMTGLYVAGFGAEDVFRQKVYDQFDSQLRRRFLRDQFDKHYEEARRRMQDCSLEICHASSSEFVLSDCPVVTWDKDRDIAGVLFGAAWGEADVIFMAVGPKYVVALSKTGRYRELTEAEVVHLNKLQVRSAYKEIFYRDGSGLGTRIAEALHESASSSH